MTAKTVQNERRLLSTLLQQFPGVIALSPGSALAAAGATSARNPEAAARQAIHYGRFPFPTSTLNGKRVFLLTDIARVLGAAGKA